MLHRPVELTGLAGRRAMEEPDMDSPPRTVCIAKLGDYLVGTRHAGAQGALHLNIRSDDG